VIDVRDWILRLLFATGVWRLWRFVHRRTVIVLTVHGVMDAHPGEAWRPLRERVSPERLDACLALLSRHYRFVSLDDAVEMLAGRRPMQPYSMVITFDDGYRNHVSHALPVLERHRVPAVVYLATGYVEHRRPFWFDRLDYALQHGAAALRSVTVGAHEVPLDATTRETLSASYAALRDEIKRIERDDRAMNDELDVISERLEAAGRARLADVFEADDWSATLRADEVRAAAHRVTFGSHTVDHLRLHRVPPDVATDQLHRSKDAVERWTGRPCAAFCYPDGGVSPEAAALVTQAGYTSAVTTVRGVNRVGEDPALLRRMDLPAHGTPRSLLASVSGFTDWMRRLARGG
jgi:peptidoglycan/xylan/chitin deacetylase (PgdA/CDA1 family)